MTADYSDREAAKRLGVHRLAVEAYALRAAWVVDVARHELRTTAGGVSGGYVVPLVRRVSVGFGRGEMNQEVGYRITEAGIKAMRQAGLR